MRTLLADSPSLFVEMADTIQQRTHTLLRYGQRSFLPKLTGDPAVGVVVVAVQRRHRRPRESVLSAC